MTRLYLAVYRGEMIEHWPKFPRAENIQAAFDEMYLSPPELSFIDRIRAKLAHMIQALRQPLDTKGKAL